MLKGFADHIVFDLLALHHGSRLGEALDFFIYDTMKIFLLLTTIIFVVAIIRSSFPPEKTKRILSSDFMSRIRPSRWNASIAQGER